MQERRIFGHGIWMTCVKQEGWRDETENWQTVFSGKLYFCPFSSVFVNGSFAPLSHLINVLKTRKTICFRKITLTGTKRA